MKKAVITSGNKQYLVSEGDTVELELLNRKKDDTKLTFVPLLVIDGDKTIVGTPEVSESKVQAEITDHNVKADKVVAIRYKAKKRVHKVHGHRQQHTTVKISKIS
jgi:large subunit ribosomal protein L21